MHEATKPSARELPVASSLRERAERLLRETDAKCGGHTARHGVGQRRELRLHQVELELQNEQLRATEAHLTRQNERLRSLQRELELSRAEYQSLFDLAPLG